MDFRLSSQHIDPDRHQNLISCSYYHPGPLHRISWQSVHSVLYNIANRQMDKKDKQTNATENTISLSEIIKFIIERSSVPLGYTVLVYQYIMSSNLCYVNKVCICNQ